MSLRAALCACLLCGTTAMAEPVPSAAIIDRLVVASGSLDDADTVPELARTIRSFDAAFAELGDGLRAAATREARLSGDLARREAEISRLLGLLLRVDTGLPVVYAMHPASPVDAARAGMLTAEVRQALQTRAGQLRAELDELRALRAVEERAETVLATALTDADTARAALVAAMAGRADLDRRFSEDPVRTAILTSSMTTLDALIDGLPQISATPIVPFAGDGDDQAGGWALPAPGTVADRTGGTALRVSTAPQALVLAPVAGLVRYRGPLFDLGNAVILEPQADRYLILAGLETVMVSTGEAITEETPLGFMGGEWPEIGTFLSLAGDPTGAAPAETLYIEAREGGRPVDPATWFRTDKDG